MASRSPSPPPDVGATSEVTTGRGGAGGLPPPDGAGQPRGARPLLTVASLAVALAAADTYVVVLALTDMMAGAGLGIESLQKGTPIISGFLLGYIAVLPLIGRLADLVSRRKILLACLMVFVVGSLITGIAVELPVMIGGRFLQGLGGGGLVPATLAIVADLWPPGRRGMPLGIVGAVQELGSVLGPMLGAGILLVSDWRGIFWVNAILGMVFALGVWVIRPDAPAGAGDVGVRPVTSARSQVLTAMAWLSALVAAVAGSLALIAPESLTSSVAYGEPFVPFGESSSRVWTPVGLVAIVALVLLVALTVRRWLPTLLLADVLGAIFVAIMLGSLVLTFSSADPAKEVLGPWGLWLLPLGALALIAFLVRQRTAVNPLIQRGVVRGRVVPALVVSLLVGAAIVAIVVDVPLLARLTEGTSETAAAIVLVQFLVAVPVGAVLGGLLLKRLGPGVVAAPGLAVTAAALWGMSGWTRGALDEPGLSSVLLVLAGFGIGLAIAPVNDAALADSTHSTHGTVSSLVVVARMVGMVVGLALLTAVGLRRFQEEVAKLADPTDSEAMLDAAVVQVQTVFAGAALAALAAAVIAIWLGWHRVRHMTPS
ncbi:MFS transporter [Ornithinimicrobium cryptoxanthini]|uniref:MFS transporter n=1 Tax=Ornithinimicrobium cryptoxanthini TaxID=2934161 RepID=A0ABY4YHD2_9MICO|nr:MFS transporter [Ornithinimicrobium cryptoxanthini]USQ76024.1 MFS transporter [Ornithinimicrobium cryptoxanthini]